MAPDVYMRLAYDSLHMGGCNKQTMVFHSLTTVDAYFVVFAVESAQKLENVLRKCKLVNGPSL